MNVIPALGTETQAYTPRIRRKTSTPSSHPPHLSFHVKMENAQRIWILYIIVLSLNCLTAEEGATAAKRHLIINAAELI